MSNDDTTGAPEDVKAKFREALERKNRQSHDDVEDHHHDESVHGGTDTHAHGGKRDFRRKDMG
jgi:hypothetical protein